MTMSFSERAAAEVRKHLVARGGGLGIRVVVETSECSGLAYRLEYVDTGEDGDLVFDSHGEKIFVDPKSLVWLSGTVIDFLEVDDDSGFAFLNPNVTSQCGCGDSFYV